MLVVVRTRITIAEYTGRPAGPLYTGGVIVYTGGVIVYTRRLLYTCTLHAYDLVYDVVKYATVTGTVIENTLRPLLTVIGHCTQCAR